MLVSDGQDQDDSWTQLPGDSHDAKLIGARSSITLAPSFDPKSAVLMQRFVKAPGIHMVMFNWGNGTLEVPESVEQPEEQSVPDWTLRGGKP